jgi:hypothetical protein
MVAPHRLVAPASPLGSVVDAAQLLVRAGYEVHVHTPRTVLLSPNAWRLLAMGRYAVVHAVDEAILLMATVARARHVPLIYDVTSASSEWRMPSGQDGLMGRAARVLEAHARRATTLALARGPRLAEAIRSLDRRLPIVQIDDGVRDDHGCCRFLEAYAAVLAGRQAHLSTVAIDM